MDKKLFYIVLSVAFVLLIIVFVQAYRWTSIEAVTARYYELKTDRDEETKRLNAIIQRSNGTVEVQDTNS